MTVRLGAALAAALLVSALAVAADPPADLKKEKEKFKGTWVVKTFEEDKAKSRPLTLKDFRRQNPFSKIANFFVGLFHADL